jgi:translocator protein
VRASTLTRTASAVVATAAAGGLATQPSSGWYRSLRLPSWQPPAATFGLVWTPLYLDLAVTSARALDVLRQRNRHAEHAAYVRALGVNLVLNAGWSVLFWRSRRPWASTVECAVLTLSAADLVRRTGDADTRAGAALLPYPIWCAFATALNAALARRNPRPRTSAP